MKKTCLLAWCLTILAFITIFSCTTKKPAVDTKTSTAATPVPASAPAVAAKKDSVPVPKYNSEIKNIIDHSCAGCHAAPQPGPMLSNPSPEPALDTYEHVKAAASNKSFWGAINHMQGFAPMPRQARKLDDDVIQKLVTWARNGMPE